MSKVMTVVGTMALETPVDKTSGSVPHLSETEVQLDREQEGEQAGASKAGENVDVDSDASVPPSQEEIVDGGNEREMVEGSEMQYHLRAIAEIEEFVSQHAAEKIKISPDLRQSLPPAVEALLSRLESSSGDDPLRRLRRTDLRGDGFGTLFGGKGEPDFHEKFGQKPEEWVTGVRLLVMTAVGTCSTLEDIEFLFLDMTIQELKALLEPLQSSSVLRDLDIGGNKIVDTKEGAKVVAEFLKYNRSLKILGLSMRNDSYIGHYLVAYGNPTLGVLRVHGSEKGEVIRGMIRACPNLQAMPQTEWDVKDEQTAKLYAQVLMEHKSFCRIRLRGPAGPVASLLLSTCSRARSVTSLTELSIWMNCDHWLSRNVLSTVILANENLKDIVLQSVLTGSEEWKRVFQALKQNGVLKSFRLMNRFDKDEGFDGRAWGEMVAMVEEGSLLARIGLHKQGEYQHDLCALIDAVTSHKQMSHFRLVGFDISAVESKAFVRLVQTNTSLISLYLGDLKGLNWEELFSSLRLNTTIKNLGLILSRTFDDRALSALLVSLQMNSVLEKISLDGTNWMSEGKFEIVEYALQEKERQGNITYAFISTSTEDKAGVLKSLQQNVSLQRLYLSFIDSDNQFDANAWDMLEALLARDNSSFQSLVVLINNQKDSQQNLLRLFEIVSSSKSLRSFTLRSSHFSWEASEALEGVIKNNTSFTELILHLGEGVHWEKLFNALRYNDGLHTLNLSSIKTLDERAFKELQATLQVNSALKVIDLLGTNWAHEGKDAIIREALEQKGRRETYMAHMKEILGQEKYDVPNTGRLFLCGSPHAGKTQLRKALTQIASPSATNGWSLKSYVQTNHDLLRTEGIEIEILNIDSLQISIWDLAGQDIFRTLQDVLFPKLNLAYIFLLVFSPFDQNTTCLKPALSEQLYREFIPWLRFIASNSHISGLMLPKVNIVVSHKDKLDMALPSDQHNLWVEGVVNGLRLQFAEVLDVEQKVFFTNSIGLGEDVQAVLHHTVESFKNLLKTKLFKVPMTCLTLGTLLAERRRYTQMKTKSNFCKKLFTFPKSCLSTGAAFAKCGTPSKSEVMREPILPMLEFFEFCQREVVSLQKIDYLHLEGQKLMTAVVEYLHDAGHIILFTESNLVIVDPNWFTFSFMGRLVGSGHDFQNPIIRLDHYKCQKDGHLSTAAFKGILQQFVQILRKEGYDGVDEILLERLMKELDLCFYVSQASGYFAPTVFVEEKLKMSSQGRRKLPNWQCVTQSSNMDHHMIFVGMRVQCRDQTRTMLTASFFPRFQVHFRNLLMSRGGIQENQIQCDYNLLYITFKGYEMYLENDGNLGDHIDILIRSPHTRTTTWKFILHNVVQEIQDFCASSRGCPGVTLVTCVLRTECVEKLTLSIHRNEHQAILVEELKRRWKDDILHKDVQSKFWKEEDIADYLHMWASNEDADLKKQYVKAKDLLTDEDYIEVLKSVKGTAESLEKQKSVLIATKNDIEKEIRERYVDVGMSSMQSDALTSETQHSTVLMEFPTSKKQLQRASSDVLMGHERTHYEIRKLGEEMGELRKDLVEIISILKDIQRDVSVVQRCQQEIFEIMMNINGKLDQIIGVIVSSARSELPSRPYLTRSDVKWTHRIIARVNVGRAVSLHFMCEERSGNHFVSGQRGYPLTVTKENAEVLRFLCVNSLKILWYLLKVGVHVAAGLGNVIPDLEPAAGATLLTASALGSLLTDPEAEKNIGAEMVDPNPKIEYTRISKELWRYLQHEVSESFKGRCAEQFKLYRARYVAAPTEASHAWLCKGCLEKGIASKAIFDE